MGVSAPPQVEPTDELVIVTLGGETIAESRRSLPVLETGRSPVYYLPLEAGMPGGGSGIAGW
jgi:uncharacterized protein (DUF427 family)